MLRARVQAARRSQAPNLHDAAVAPAETVECPVTSPLPGPRWNPLPGSLLVPHGDALQRGEWPELGWTETLRDLVNEASKASGALARPMSLVSGCSGIAAELWAARALGMHVGPVIMAEKDIRAQKFMGVHHGQRITHLFKYMTPYMSTPTRGSCCCHGKECIIGSVNWDCFVAGTPLRGARM